jgi:uncharacterized protein (TIGR02594 family)
MLHALGELGVHEIPGPGASPRIVQYDQVTTLKATSDEIPWCSSFVNWCMSRDARLVTGSAAASSWLSYGYGVGLTYGAIAVLRRPGGHHVAFVIDWDDGAIWLLGGNQSNQVCIRAFSRVNLLDARWPMATSSSIDTKPA